MKQTTINLPSGKTATGYIGADGKTYKDPQAKQRIDYGTIVNTNGGTYKYTENGSVKVPDGTVNTVSSTPGPKQTTATDANGNSSNAYLINGTAYTNPQGGERVANGSVVKTGGGTYYKASDTNSARLTHATGHDETFSYGGNLYKVYRGQDGRAYVDAECTTLVPQGAAISGNDTNSMNTAYGELPNGAGILGGYDERIANSKSSLQSAADARAKIADEQVEAALARLKLNEERVKEDYKKANDAAQQMYLNASNPYGVNAEQLAALGLTKSGFAESSLVSMMNTYQTAINGNSADRADALLELELAAEEAVREGNRQKYDLYASMYDKLAELDMHAADAYAQNAKDLLGMEQDDRHFYDELSYESERDNADRAEQARQFDKEYNLNYEKLQHEIKKAQNEQIRDLYMTVLNYAKAKLPPEQMAYNLGVDVQTIKDILSDMMNIQRNS